MAESEELKKIKKKYGEKFMHLCRELFPTILENERELLEILTTIFSDNCKTLYEDITAGEAELEFKQFILDVYNQKRELCKKKEIITDKNPYELLEEAGYILYECKTEEDIQKFRKYYRFDEELCTFNGRRLERCFVFFAVKKNAEDIKRKDFKNPRREDEYGTSVMSIQFEKNGICTCSIKNRYNHTVINPDATYGNDLDKIIPGLSYSFKKLLKERGLDFEKNNVQLFELDHYQVANDGKYYKYNVEREGVYFCPGNIIIKNGMVKKLEHPESQLLINYYIVDLKNKTISLADSSLKDSFPEVIGKIEDIKISKKENGRKVLIIKQKLYDDPIVITIDKNDRIIEYKDNNTKTLPDDFMNNNSVEALEMNSLQEAGENFFKISPELKSVSLPNLKKLGNQGFMGTKILEHVEFPSLVEVEDDFLVFSNLKEAKFPELKRVGNSCLEMSDYLELLYLPKIEQIGNQFLALNRFLKRLNLPELRVVGDKCLEHNNLEELVLPKLERAGSDFIIESEKLKKIDFPNLKQVGDNFGKNIFGIISVNLPQLERAGEGFFMSDERLNQLNSKILASLDKKSNLRGEEIAEAKSTLKILKKQEKEKVN